MTDETLDTEHHRDRGAKADSEPSPGFVIIWAAADPALVGAWLPLAPGRALALGRAGAEDEDRDRLLPVRQRPGENVAAPPLADPFLSREQLRITAKSDGIHVSNVGKRDLLDGLGRVTSELVVRSGDVVEIRGRLLLYATERPRQLPVSQNLDMKKLHPFGEADGFGLVGETEAAWRLRDGAAFVASRSAHVLLLGESGTGKEIVARTIHERSASGKKRMVSRNAATLPAGLIDAELFGHVANYPNVGMPERLGLIGDADGSTLFLDEIGELPHELSTKLLRVLDEGGEYQRLGDTRARNSKFRLVGATNRALAMLKHDVAARFRLRISVPPLGERNEDIPLLARHLLRRAAVQDPAIGARFFEGWDGRSGEPRLAIDLVKALVTHRYTTNIRELDVLLWSSLGSSSDAVAELTPDVLEGLALDEPEPSQRSRIDVKTLTAEDVKAAIERAGGSHDKAWRELGLGNRHVLKRLVKKFGLRE